MTKRTAQLDAETRFVDAVLGAAAALIVVLDRNGRVVRANKACEEASGLSAEQLRGRYFEEVIPPEERASGRQVFEHLLEGRFPNRHENHWLRRDGTRRLIAWSNTCLLDAAGAVQYLVGTGVDVTEQRKAEQELQQRQVEIARLRRLHAMGELASLLAHDLNQPLAAIAGFGEASLGLLQRGEGGDRLRRNLEQIVAQAERAGRSIQDLRQFLGKDHHEKVPVDLNAVLLDACNLVEVLARARCIRLNCAGGTPLPRVVAPAIQVEHVLVNLLQNAIDAVGDEGEVTVRVRCEGKDSVQVSVEDSGPGVDNAIAQRVFEPLYTTKSNGLGLGLSICRSIIEAQGGRIWAEPGPGGKFHFTLPIAR
ncbi:MAG TPA: ATP-binding protein [Burkholderiales bacterium]|nr:ATP-binding protein [Burkholderiales bacterium]